MPTNKNKGPLLVDKVRGYFDRLPEWLRDNITVRSEKQKVDASITDLDHTALESKLIQEVTDEKLRTNNYLGDGEAGSGNDTSGLPTSHPSEIVIQQTGQVANVTESVGSSEVGLVEGPPLQDGSSEQVGDLWVTKKVEAPTFDDKVYQLQREDLIPKEFRALVPEKLEAHTTDGNAALPTLSAGELVRREEQKKVGVKTVTVQSRDMSSTPVLSGKRMDAQWNGAILGLEQKIVPADSTITQVFGMTDANIKPIDGTNSVQEIWKLDPTSPEYPNFPTIVTQKFDSDLQTNVSTYQTIEVGGSAYSPTTGDVDYEDKVLDYWHLLRKVDRVTGVASFSTYTTQMITFPGILSYISFSLIQLAAAGRKEVQWTAGIRAPFTTPTKVRNLTEFFWTPQAPYGLYTWAPTDITFKGVALTVSIGSVLSDTWSNMGVTFAGDTYYGNAVDRFSISATTPSATSYVNGIGYEAVIASVVDRYKRLWIRKTSFIILQ